jgi:hypothetical protein
MTYRKPLKNGGHALIARAGNGRFARFSLGAEVCAHENCRAIVLPEFVEDPATRFLEKRWPDTCHRCGRADWREASR